MRPRLKMSQDQEPQQKRLKLFDDSESFDSFSRQELDICSEMKGSYTENEKSSGAGSTENNLTGSDSDVGTQTEISKHLLSAKIDTMLLKNEFALTKTDQKIGSRTVSSISYETIANDSALMKHFVGLSSEQFEALHNFLNSVCPLDEITHWNGKEKSRGGEDAMKPGAESQFSSRESLFHMPPKIKMRIYHQTMSVLLSSPDIPVKETMIRKIFTIYIQLMYRTFHDIDTVMFPTCDQMGNLPEVFMSMENIGCIVDCTEFKVEMSRNFAQQGNTY